MPCVTFFDEEEVALIFFLWFIGRHITNSRIQQLLIKSSCFGHINIRLRLHAPCFRYLNLFVDIALNCVVLPAARSKRSLHVHPVLFHLTYKGVNEQLQLMKLQI